MGQADAPGERARSRRGRIMTPETTAMLGTPVGFGRMVLGFDYYPKQEDVLFDLTPPGAVVSARCVNGAGKTARINVTALLWHLATFPLGTVVCTAGVYRQVSGQLWPQVERLASRLPGWDIGRGVIAAPNGARAYGFATRDAGKFEGFHGSPQEPLMIIVDEAKSVRDEIFHSIERCQPQRILLTSSAGRAAGEFFRSHTSKRAFYSSHTIGVKDCPHILPEWVEKQIAKWGREHPLVRSMVFNEFVGADDADLYVLSLSEIEFSEDNQPRPTLGEEPVAFCDFAAGGDENVLAVRRGNAVKIEAAWRDRNTMAAVGRFVLEFRKAGLKAENIGGDDDGIGHVMIDRLAEVGWPIRRVSNADRPENIQAYKNRGTEIWMESAKQITAARVAWDIADEELRGQLISRKLFMTSDGVLRLETKDELRARELGSPDRADAMLGAIWMKAKKETPPRPGTTVATATNRGRERGQLAGAYAGG
jgi:phage terminase large subunit